MSIIIDSDICEVLHNVKPDMTSEELNDLVKNILCIVNDGKIDYKDIPHLICVIENMYSIVNNSTFDSEQNRIELTEKTVKLIFHILVEKDKIPVSAERKNDFLVETDNIIHSCMKLLALNGGQSMPVKYSPNSTTTTEHKTEHIFEKIHRMFCCR